MLAATARCLGAGNSAHSIPAHVVGCIDAHRIASLIMRRGDGFPCFWCDTFVIQILRRSLHCRVVDRGVRPGGAPSKISMEET
jgi:hypothetical protein